MKPIDGDPLVMRISLAEAAARFGGRPVYMASPYTEHARRGVAGVRLAVDEAARWAGALYCAGMNPISPILNSHAACEHAPALDPLDGEFWLRQCLPWLRRSDALVAPPISGWMTSRGVAREIDEARASNIPVILLERPDD